MWIVDIISNKKLLKLSYNESDAVEIHNEHIDATIFVIDSRVKYEIVKSGNGFYKLKYLGWYD